MNQDAKRLEELFDRLADSSLNGDFSKRALSEELACSWKNLFTLPQEKLKNYFGEKVAIFFFFSSYKIKSSLGIALFLIVTEIVNAAGLETPLSKKYMIYVNIVVIIIWNNILVSL